MINDGLIAWLDLEQRLFQAARPVEAAFIALNESHAMVPFRQAALWSRADGVVALSGGAAVDAGAPYVLWLGQVFSHLAPLSPALRALSAADLPERLAAGWADWLPEQALLVPMGDEAMIFAREEPFADAESHWLDRMGALLRLSRQALAPRPTFGGWLGKLKRRKVQAIAAAAVLLALFPVTGSVLAPADAVPAQPVVVRAPLDGVVGRILVRPNDPVAEGQILVEMDTTTLAGKLDVARQRLATAEAEYRQAAQAMVFDAKAKVQVAILSARAEENAAEVRLLESQFARVQIKAPKAGTAIIDDPSEWIGKPVTVGEKIMAVADEGDTEVEAWLSPADVGEVRPDARLTLFLNTHPLSPLTAIVRTVAYEASARPDATLAHRVRATLADGEAKPRLGLKGTARIDGDTVPLVWWLFRRPLGTIRQFIGF